ncbi:leucine aminopeptidase-like protein [Elysia marginata]|uniref:Cytosol aminopeptidase n=1 Tax=Elysia marginata TaxID=1093978 RepID=A0AAV4H8I3_9GAST|nr:leucine aminopeptidase-like protein [Elysia marginata]
MSSLFCSIARVPSQSRRGLPLLHQSSKVTHRFSKLLSTSVPRHKGLVLGVYEPASEDGQFLLTPTAQQFNKQVSGKLESLLKSAGRKLKCGSSRVLYGIEDSEYTSVAVANLGKQDVDFDAEERIYQGKENVRTAVAGAVRLLRDAGETEVGVETCGDAQASAEASLLSLHSFDEFRQEKDKQPSVSVTHFASEADQGSQAAEHWLKGETLARAQNFARYLMESPANRMTPSIFCDKVKENLSQLPNCTVTIRDQAWAQSMKMGSFLSVAKGSEEEPKFLEIDYLGGKQDDAPVIFVGKGVTFDSGGISIKPSANMDKMRADMGGAACVAGSLQAAASLGLPINIKALIPLCENMPSGKANKPGDVVTAMNGKSIQIDNTDAEGRLILADALCYAESFQPKLILDIATLTGAVAVALGAAVTGTYTKSEPIWNTIQTAGMLTGDRMWRMPLLKYYSKQVTKADLADLDNVGKKKGEAGSCTAAAFLQEFVTTKEWVHLDMAGVMINTDDVPYLGKGMSGRPTRTLVQFLELLSQQ